MQKIGVKGWELHKLDMSDAKVFALEPPGIRIITIYGRLVLWGGTAATTITEVVLFPDIPACTDTRGWDGLSMLADDRWVNSAEVGHLHHWGCNGDRRHTYVTWSTQPMLDIIDSPNQERLSSRPPECQSRLAVRLLLQYRSHSAAACLQIPRVFKKGQGEGPFFSALRGWYDKDRLLQLSSIRNIRLCDKQGRSYIDERCQRLLAILAQIAQTLYKILSKTR